MASVIILTIVTIGIYGLVWEVKTKNEMNTKGANIPTAWLLIVPIANIWWLWKYCEGVELVTKNKLSAIMSFVLFWLIGIVGMAIVQHEFNKIGDAPATAEPIAAAPAEQPAATASTDVATEQQPAAPAPAENTNPPETPAV